MNFGPQLMSDAEEALKETHRILRSGGLMGTTCWVKAGWIPSVMATFPDFKPPGLLKTDTGKKPESVKAILMGIRIEDVEVMEHAFMTRLGLRNMDSFLELMGLLMPALLHGENAENYGRYIRDEVEKGGVLMGWMALIVSARKL
jgi:hypothetical protein